MLNVYTVSDAMKVRTSEGLEALPALKGIVKPLNLCDNIFVDVSYNIMSKSITANSTMTSQRDVHAISKSLTFVSQAELLSGFKQRSYNS